jgi:hypothetical protein
VKKQTGSNTTAAEADRLCRNHALLIRFFVYHGICHNKMFINKNYKCTLKSYHYITLYDMRVHLTYETKIFIRK